MAQRRAQSLSPTRFRVPMLSTWNPDGEGRVLLEEVPGSSLLAVDGRDGRAGRDRNVDPTVNDDTHAIHAAHQRPHQGAASWSHSEASAQESNSVLGSGSLRESGVASVFFGEAGNCSQKLLVQTMNHSTRLAILRTDLANERTFLAWIRTSTSLVALGFALDKFSDSDFLTDTVSALALVLLGILSALFGTLRYYRFRVALSNLVKQAELSIGRLGMKWFISAVGLVTVSIMAVICMALVWHRSPAAVSQFPRLRHG